MIECIWNNLTLSLIHIFNLQEVIQNMKSEQTTPTSTPTPAPTEEPIQINEDDIVFPEHEQVITEEDQVEPQGNDLQLVFLGDSIFDSNRDGTGIPYLTAVQCNADVYNLAIGGTTATIKLTPVSYTHLDVYKRQGL